MYILLPWDFSRSGALIFALIVYCQAIGLCYIEIIFSVYDHLKLIMALVAYFRSICKLDALSLRRYSTLVFSLVAILHMSVYQINR